MEPRGREGCEPRQPGSSNPFLNMFGGLMGRTSSGDPAAATEEEPSPPAKEQPRSNHSRDSPIPAFSPSILKAVYRETSSTVKSAYANVEERIAFAVEERAVADSVAIHLLRTELAAAEAALAEALAESARLRQQVIANGKDNKSANGKDNKSRPHPTRPYMATAALTQGHRTSNADNGARRSPRHSTPLRSLPPTTPTLS